ncbi:hypothetical protein DPEC_G00194760 [Dallia pectoralis]|uniref:Uncharacterized protein n=1 Tax=Dallia pectoralis TaxID=75939 RepID=A0ACC2G7N5_DALPE|nr:hypothetical protein DPEC_G00194760 [Dallia pectoralis]
MWIFIQLSVLTSLALAQNDCYLGACYPPIEELLLGRGQLLHVSSTCGLTGSEVFCSPLGLSKMKCCPCDSRNPSSRLAHTIQDVLPGAGPQRWWQSKKDDDPVTIQLDLENPFQLDTLLLTFKGPRPNALAVERTLDNGKTWRPAVYMATDCSTAFPGVAVTTPRSLDDTYCRTMPPPPANPYQEQTIQFKPLRQYSAISAPHGEKIEEVSGLTGLRVKLTELGTVPRLPGRSPSRFYALKEMSVMGSCLCHGHANRCQPDTSFSQLARTLVSAQCECQHNTAGVNCERCADLYNNRPWRAAEESNTHTCQRCECNNHALRCRFDPAVYEASGRRSGGVCEGCLHHTTGPKCDRCAPGYQPNPRSSMDRPDACIVSRSDCSCNAEGAENQGLCDDITGACRCKANVEGSSCNRCVTGYYGLTASNPLGCTKCSCSVAGSTTSVCDSVTGQCSCRPQFKGRTCDLCSHGYWNPSSPRGCEPCRCDPANSLSDTCDQVTGQCRCRSGFGGRTCGGCPDNTYGSSVTGCRVCQCVAEGTVSGGCDKHTGACMCRPGITGTRCDTCRRGYCKTFPNCEVCPSCFTDLDLNIKSLNTILESLSNRVSGLPGGALPSSLVPRIRAMEDRLNYIKYFLPLPPTSTRQVNDALSLFTKLRKNLDQADRDLLPPIQDPELSSELDELQDLLNKLSLRYISTISSSENFNNIGDISAIKKAFDKSTDAAKKVTASEKTVDQSTAVRKTANDLQKEIQSANTADLEKLNQQLNTKPDLRPTAKQVCGSTRWDSCTPANCDGDLCPPEAQPCGRREDCVGALPLGTLAVTDAEEVKDRLQKLNDTIKQATSQIEETQETAKMLQKSMDALADKTRKTSNDLEADLNQSRDFVKELKNFLSDPTLDPTLISRISEEVLKAKLPDNLPALKRKLQRIRDLLAGLPSSTAVLDRTGPQLQTALSLLQEAKEARDVTLGMKADADGLLGNLVTQDDALSNLDDKVKKSMAIVNNVNGELGLVKDILFSAEKTLTDVPDLVNGITQLNGLKDLVTSGVLLAQNATGEADKASDEADAAAKELEHLLEQLEKLRAANRTSGSETAGERLLKLQKEAGSLANETDVMMTSLEGKTTSLHELQREVLIKSVNLTGLETQLQNILVEIREKVKFLTIC